MAIQKILLHRGGMTGEECKQVRLRLGLKQTKLAWDVGIDPTLISRWESGVYKLRAAQVAAVRAYLTRCLQTAKTELAALQLPEAVEVNKPERRLVPLRVLDGASVEGLDGCRSVLDAEVQAMKSEARELAQRVRGER